MRAHKSRQDSTTSGRHPAVPGRRERTPAARPVQHASQRRAASAERGTILVAEDDDEIREAVADALTCAGYDVVLVGNGETALTVLRGMPRLPDLILLDLMMPRMDGWEFRQAQRRDPELASIPVVVVTAHAAQRKDEWMPCCAELLHKPVGLDALLDVVRRHRRRGPGGADRSS